MHSLPRFIVAVAFACAASGSFAATSGHVTQGGLAYTLLDLDPLDGITPELTFAPLRYPVAAYISSYYYYNGGTGYDSPVGVGSDPVEANLNPNAFVGSAALIDGRTAPTTEVVTADVHTQLNGTMSQVDARMTSDALGFTLTPRTQVTFTTLAIARGTVEGDVGDTLEWVLSWNALELREQASWDLLQHDYVEWRATRYAGDPLSFDETRTMSVTFANPGGNDSAAALQFYSELWAMSMVPFVPEVPEPAIIHALPTGLAIAGWLAWRRSRHCTQ